MKRQEGECHELHSVGVFPESCGKRKRYTGLQSSFHYTAGCQQTDPAAGGCELFIRRANHLVLTREGDFLYEHAKNIVTRINDLPSEMSSFLHRVSGKLTIGCGPHTSRTIMPDLIADLNRKYPAIQPVMFEKDWSESTEDLLTGKLDIVVGVTPHRSEKIAFTRLFKSRMVLIYSRKSPLAKEKKITPELLEKQPYITYTDESILRNCLRALPYPVRSPLFLQTRYSETIITYVQKNMGVWNYS